MLAQKWNEGWKFYLEKVEEAPFRHVSRKNQEAEGYAARHFDETYWEDVTLPHDWGMTLPYYEPASRSHGHYPVSTVEMDGQVPGLDHYMRVPTKGWYRKRFFVPKEDLGKRIVVEFEGAYRDSRVWINGQYIDRFASGYMGFRCDLTDNLYYGEENVLAVCCDTQELEGWWYEGAGIYRNVFYVTGEPLHLDKLTIRTQSDMQGNFALSGEAINESDEAQRFDVQWAVKDGDKPVLCGSVSCATQPWDKVCYQDQGVVSNPRLWSPDAPNLYTLSVTIVQDGNVIDTETMEIGFRTFRFDNDFGLFINEIPTKIRGACIHQDFAGVGVALPDALQSYKIRRLKEMGCNAYRSSHNAPAPEIVSACDRLGMLLMDETRMFGSTPDALRNTLDLVRRDRNHACVLMWSIGNEEHSVQNTQVGARITDSILRAIRREDDTRVITYGGNNGGNYDGINAQVDVRGINYVHIGKEAFVDQYHKEHPHQPMYGSEETSFVTTRGEYTGTVAYPDAYGEYSMPWASTAEGWWKYYSERSFLSGGFMWTGMDYFGEPTPYERNSSTCFGAMDLCGFAKDVYYYYRAWWHKEPMVHLFPHWNWEDGDNVRVVVYSNCDEIVLCLNGKVLDKKPMEKNGHLEWNIPFEKGEITAIGYSDGKETACDSRKTAGDAKSIRLSRENAQHGENIVLVKAEITDENGIPVPNAAENLTFTVEGSAKLLGVGNGDPASKERNQFGYTKEKVEVLEWYRDGTPWNVFTLRTGEHYHLHNVAMQLTREENKEPFRDRVRNVGRYANASYSTQFDGYFLCDDPAKWQMLEFAKLEGNYTVILNGECIGKGNNNGYPVSFAIKPVKGKNHIEIRCSDMADAGGVYNGVWLTRQIPEIWQRKTFHALALAILQVDGAAKLKVSSENIPCAELSL